ncbi:sam dependent methyltransferase [Grosmannia clavigera kw1407]|uniref:Sam dependent methyltransferase n=1 Tax=Grosmannia clavigera (strain kw1407 / UAMH 11150) TaxID=655863 RepID=F0XSF4_GROCL|nr:sam dependent methyltransferase [Grosmannia clavigera kw1407]EFW99172.1 sam dependent methyltransferase [Grosmannia clavigera kw1407]
MEPTKAAGSPTPASAGPSPPTIPLNPGPRGGQSEPSLILPTVALPTSTLNNFIRPGDEPGEIFGDDDSALGSDVGSSTGSITSSILHYRTLNGRTYHNDRNNTQYWGANDDAQNNSVDIMHHAFTLLLGNKLHLAPLPDKVEKVLDLGTGTGIWAIDFADEHPDAQVVGIDLSPIQPSWIPPNVSFQIDDFTEPWSFEDNSFDFIYLRWLCGAVRDWVKLFSKVYRALRPGGWIESFDFDSKYLSDDDTLNDQTAIYQWDHIFNEGARKAGLNVTCLT